MQKVSDKYAQNLSLQDFTEIKTCLRLEFPVKDIQVLHYILVSGFPTKKKSFLYIRLIYIFLVHQNFNPFMIE